MSLGVQPTEELSESAGERTTNIEFWEANEHFFKGVVVVVVIQTEAGSGQ